MLADLSVEPPSWEISHVGKQRKISREGVPAYLTKIVSSPLSWIEDDEVKERVWEATAQRLSERSGRTGMGDMKRVFRIPRLPPGAQDPEGPNVEEAGTLELILHEPAMQEDNLGLKTWASSYLLAKRLVLLRSTLPVLPPNAHILELGAGTGLVGLAAAAVFGRHVVLTDLPGIVPNLTRNLEANAAAPAATETGAEAAVLDWSNPSDFSVPSSSVQAVRPNSFPLILAADPIYSPAHPRLLVQTIAAHLSRTKEARLIVELPLREAFGVERADLRSRLEGLGLKLLDEGEEVGYDDWVASDGEREEVRCWWGVWGW